MLEFEALRKAKEEDDIFPDGFWHGKSPKCPHCGEVCDISKHDWYDLYEEGEHEKSCPHCGGDFTISTHVSFSFRTDQQEGCDD